MKTGIYKIVHKTSGKIYIGSAVDIDKRWGEHIRALRRSDHRNIHLQRAWNKYGEHSFIFGIVEYTQQDILLEREQHYLDTLNVCDTNIGYNIAPTAGNSLGIRRSDEFKEKVRQGLLGKILTNEHKENIGKGVSESQKYRDAMASPEYKEKMKVANLGDKNPMFGKYGKDHPKAKSIDQYTKEGEYIKTWDSVLVAARHLKRSHANISSCCKGRLKTAYGFVWKYAD